MSIRRASARWLPPWLLAASALGVGCLAGAPFHLAADAPRSSEFERVVLLPMNFDRSPSPAIAPGTGLMGDRIRGHLEELGFDVVEPRMSATLGLWKKCTEEVGGIADERGQEVDEVRYEQARSDLVRRTLERLPADGAIAGTVMVRPGRYAGRKLHWDGVSRPVSVDMAETNLPVLSLNGKDLGVSLRTTVFDRSGRKIFERYVGLEPLRRTRRSRTWPTSSRPTRRHPSPGAHGGCFERPSNPGSGSRSAENAAAATSPYLGIGRFQPIGDTDSEHASCALLDELEPAQNTKNNGLPWWPAWQEPCSASEPIGPGLQRACPRSRPARSPEIANPTPHVYNPPR